MEKITVVVKVDQADAIKAGLDTYGAQEILIQPSELTPRQRQTLSDVCKKRHFLSENAQGHLRPTFEAPGLVEATQSQVQILLDKMADEADDEQEKIKARVAKSIESILAAPMDDLISSSLDVVSVGSSKFCFIKDEADLIMADPRIQQRWVELKLRAEDLRKARDAQTAQRQKETLALEEKKAAAEARRNEQLEAWVAEHASLMQKTRHARGLLPESEILDGIRDAIFSPLDSLPRYDRISAKEVRDSYIDGDCFVPEDEPAIFSTSVPEAITDEQMQTVLFMENALKNCAVKSEIRLHSGVLKNTSAEDDEAYGVRRLGVLLTVQVGEIKLSREYALNYRTQAEAASAA